MTPAVVLTDTVLHGGFQYEAGAELDVDEATAESLLERGLAEKPGRRGQAPPEPAWHDGLDKHALLKLAADEGVDGVKGTMGKPRLVELIEAHRAAKDEDPEDEDEDEGSDAEDGDGEQPPTE